MSIHITLNQIKAHSPCEYGWKKVLKLQGGTKADYDRPFPVSSILDSNGLGDTLWVLRCLPDHDNLWRLYAVWCARQLQHLMKDQRSIDALDVAERYARGLATYDELRAAADSARDAADAADAAARDATRATAWAAAWDAAWAAAYAAADSARDAADAADAAARAAAWDSARANAERQKQADKLRQILDAGEWL